MEQNDRNVQRNHMLQKELEKVKYEMLEVVAELKIRDNNYSIKSKFQGLNGKRHLIVAPNNDQLSKKIKIEQKRHNPPFFNIPQIETPIPRSFPDVKLLE